jgi:ATP-dependent protease Clp ATPase subunit
MNDPEPTCSFCHQPKSKVGKLISGDGQVAICNHCVAVCYDVLRREGFDMTLRDQPPKDENESGNS